MSKFLIEVEHENGWSRWVPPNHKSYKMACCDCGLVHDMEFRAVEVKKVNRDGSWTWEPLSAKKYRVMFRARRNNRSTGQIRRHDKARKEPKASNKEKIGK